MPLKKCASNPALTSSQINNSEFNGTFNLVVAYSFDKQGIGFQGTIPWHIPEDMAHLRKLQYLILANILLSLTYIISL